MSLKTAPVLEVGSDVEGVLRIIKAGFVDIKRRSTGDSDDPYLRLVEKHGINMSNGEMTAFETEVLQARKTN